MISRRARVLRRVCNSLSAVSTSGTPSSQREDAVEAGEDAVAAEDFQQMIEARADGAAGRGHAHGMHEQPGLDAQFGHDGFQRFFERRRIECRCGGEGVSQFRETRFHFRA